ncbi:E3 SUMO-protein ligase NSE2 isoform X4 [Ovis canadensis]|uniref:E3 SUMO-protein ligase NSE2 isoform X4 n=2 Tax=Ovis canadensis TaxID=37174 RepID=UPI00375336CD
MPGRSTSSSGSGSTGFISFSGVESALSSLKNFQSCISSGMDTASSVALDLVETQTEVSSEYSMDKAMVEFAMMDRELNHYLKAVQSTINHVKEERSEKIPDLKLLVEKKFLALQNKNSDADFQNNEKFVQFKQQLKELKKQLKPKEDGGQNEFDKIKDKDASRAGNERDLPSSGFYFLWMKDDDNEERVHFSFPCEQDVFQSQRQPECQCQDRDSLDRTEKTTRLVRQNYAEVGQHYGKLKMQFSKLYRYLQTWDILCKALTFHRLAT